VGTLVPPSFVFAPREAFIPRPWRPLGSASRRFPHPFWCSTNATCFRRSRLLRPLSQSPFKPKVPCVLPGIFSAIELSTPAPDRSCFFFAGITPDALALLTPSLPYLSHSRSGPTGLPFPPDLLSRSPVTPSGSGRTLPSIETFFPIYRNRSGPRQVSADGPVSILGSSLSGSVCFARSFGQEGLLYPRRPSFRSLIDWSPFGASLGNLSVFQKL